MDPLGAKHLAARLKAGVKPRDIVMVDGNAPDWDLVAGDIGVVKDVTLDGILVEWERGFSRRFDPEGVAFHTLA